MTDGKQKKILLIDDDTSLLMTLSDFLGFEGYDITTADSGEQGLKRLAKMTPDLIILDMSMPGMGGVGFLKEISDEQGKPRHPVLVLTARANMAEFFADVEVDGFVAKPCEPGDLLMEVARILFLRSGGEAQEKAKAAPKIKILLGEDDVGVSQVLTSEFRQAGHVVLSVSKGPDVMERAIVEHPDLLVLKLVLAGMNGDAVASMLSQLPNTRNIPIVLYDDSGSELPETKFTQGGTGIRKFVRTNKTTDLLAAIKTVVGT